MKLAIHQPEYWPIPRLLAKWAQADLLVLLNTTQFDRTSLQHRCKLASPDGVLRWLTIPFDHEGPRVLRDLVPHGFSWTSRHRDTIREWYRFADAERLRDVATFYDALKRYPLPSISDYAEATMVVASNLAEIRVPTQRVSDLTPPDGHWGAKADLVLNICRAVGATTYLSGRSGYEYLLPHEPNFTRAGIKIEIQTYPQAAEVPGLSSLHVYLAHGPARLKDLVTRR